MKDADRLTQIERLTRFWSKGVLARGEYFPLMLECLTSDTLAEFRRAVTDEWLGELAEHVGEAPSTGEEWARVAEGRGRFAGAGVRLLTELEAIAAYRLGVETFRRYRGCLGVESFSPITADPAWFTPTVLGLTTGIYEQKAFDRLPILADALEEAGCSEPEMLDHCRGDGPHVRGCWVVDLLIGKE